MSVYHLRRSAIAPAYVAPIVPALVQSAIASTTSAPTVSCSWPGATTLGNLLVMCIAAQGGSTLTTPTGWTKVAEVAGTGIKVAIYYIQNASSRSGSESLTFTSPPAFMALAEYSGVAASGALDTYQTSTGTSTTGGTGTVVTSNASSVLVGIIGYFDAILAYAVPGSPSGGFALEKQAQAGTHYDADMLDRIVATTGSYGTTTTTNFTINWAGMVAAFKGA